MTKSTSHSDYHWKKIAAMMQKDLDEIFLQYGMNQDDLNVLEIMATKEAVSPKLVKRILSAYQNKKTKTEGLTKMQIAQILEKELLSSV